MAVWGRRRVVGISCSGGTAGPWELPTDFARVAYAHACEKAGLLPVLLPVTEDEAVRSAQLDLIDGLLLTGGNDIHPRFYGAGEDVHPATEANEGRRDAHEIALTREAIARDQPVFAICRGLQVLNVALGGTLHQDIPNHRQEAHTTQATACARISPGSCLAGILGGADVARVNSHHHQAARAIAPGLVVTARADDGTVEALEKPGARFILAVQWHPENLYERDAPARALFGAFSEVLSEGRP